MRCHHTGNRFHDAPIVGDGDRVEEEVARWSRIGERDEAVLRGSVSQPPAHALAQPVSRPGTPMRIARHPHLRMVRDSRRGVLTGYSNRVWPST